MRKLVKYTTVLTATALSSLMYPRDMLVPAAFMALVLFVFVQLWTATYEQAGGGPIAGLTRGDLIWYLVLTETVVLSAPRISQKIDEEVKSGELALTLVRPYNYVLYHLARYWGEAALRLPLNFAAGATIALAACGPPAVTPLSAAAGLVALALALTLNFAVETAIGLTAFWFEDTMPFFWIYQKLVFSLGGLFLPLDLFPQVLAAIARFLPFAGVTYAPARLFVSFSWEALAGLLMVQVLWLLALGCLMALVYTRAVRKVNIHGG
jgi:ABC-2 type transport system permease protein